MNTPQKIFLQVRLPLKVAESIQMDADKKALKRGPMCRMALLEALNLISVDEVMQLKLYLNRTDNAETVLISFTITDQINASLLELCNYLPVSKRKMAEILICQQVIRAQEGEKQGA